MPEAVLRIEGLRKNFGSLVVTDDVTLDIVTGEMHAIIGPNGAGKTTLINQISGLIPPDAGTILFAGRDLTTLGESELTDLRASAFGFVFQTFNLIPTLTAAENVETALVPFAVRSHKRRLRALEALEGLGLADRSVRGQQLGVERPKFIPRQLIACGARDLRRFDRSWSQHWIVL